MNRIFNRLLNVKGTVVEDARIADSPLRSEPVLEIRCSDAPDAANAGTVMTKAAARAVGGIRRSEDAGPTSYARSS
ncbi:hypothetical protein [Bifidobacterium longum]|uniref:hypothetical protein n=1 Tax=Bifidobacterium longum TaxID=216816 RepID=UPI001F0EA379|nr:hypothetical protein [Bifidobacterium longum]MCH4837701.1 hypothetical protein [Bifidobacterium longum]